MVQKQMAVKDDMEATQDNKELDPDEHICPQCACIVKKSSEICPKCRVRLLNPPYLELDIHNENFMI